MANKTDNSECELGNVAVGKKDPVPITSEEILSVKCGNRVAAFYPGKCKKMGKGMSKCILYQGKWVNPSEFETMAGIQARKWKQSIKYGGKPLGAWLAQHPVLEPIPTASQLEHQDSNGPDTMDRQLITSNEETVVDTDGCHDDEGSAMTTVELLTMSSCSTSNTMSMNKELINSQPGSSDNCLPHSLNVGMEGRLSGMEKKMRDMLTESISSTFNQLREFINGELHSMRTMIDSLSTRISQLEKKLLASKNMDDQTLCEPSKSEQSGKQKALDEMVSKTQSIQAQVEEISAVVSSQKHIIERSDREKREKNVVIIGLQEGVKQPEAEVRDLFETKLNLGNIKPVSVKRLGLMDRANGKSRPVLVVLESVEDKHRVMKAKANLKEVASNIYINNDLTREQREIERDLRRKKQLLIKLPEYKGKHITVYKGRLWVDRVAVSERDLISAGLSQ